MAVFFSVHRFKDANLQQVLLRQVQLQRQGPKTLSPLARSFHVQMKERKREGEKDMAAVFYCGSVGRHR